MNKNHGFTATQLLLNAIRGQVLRQYQAAALIERKGKVKMTPQKLSDILRDRWNPTNKQKVAIAKAFPTVKVESWTK